MGTRNRISAGGISFLIYTIIFLLSSLPGRSLPSGIPDYIPHFLEYFFLAYFVIQIFNSPRRPSTILAAAMALAALGFLDEWHQRSVPGRIFSWLDLLYDILGVMGGLLAFRIMIKWKTGKTGKVARR
jgi:VanZ family protein